MTDAPAFVDDPTFVDDIEGYCTPLSCTAGASVALHVSTRADRYDVVVERWGAHRDELWRAEGVPGTYVEPPVDADAHGCRWPVSIEIPVDASWQPGFHLVTLRAHGSREGLDVAHACFVVRSPTPTSPMLLVLDTNTWNAYNTWGGRSLYTGGHRVSFARPFGRGMLCRPAVDRDDRKARPTRWGEEPDVDGRAFQDYRTERRYPAAIGSTGWFTHTRRFVEWAEAAGYQFDVAISSDLEADPGIVDDHDLVLSVGHDEYWSAGQRDTVERHVAVGGDLASFSGNTMFWQVRLDAGAEGPDMVCHKYAAHLDDPVVGSARSHEMTGMWADPLVGRPEWRLLGAGSAFGLYHRFGRATARGVGGFVVYRPEHWLLEGTGLGYGDVIGSADGVVGYETVGLPIQLDEFQRPVAVPRADLPERIEIVGHVPSSNLTVGEYPASISALDDQGDLEFIATRIHGADTDENRLRVRNGNAVMLTCRPYGDDAGGEVVTVGTTDWVFGLERDAQVQRVTANVLDRFGRRTSRS